MSAVPWKSGPSRAAFAGQKFEEGLQPEIAYRSCDAYQFRQTAESFPNC